MSDVFHISLLPLMLGELVFLIVVGVWLRIWMRTKTAELNRERERIIQEGKDDIRKLKEDTLRELDCKKDRFNLQCEQEHLRMKSKMQDAEHLVQKHKDLVEAYEDRLRTLEGKNLKLDETKENLMAMMSQYRSRLEELSGMSHECAKEALFEEIRRECEDEFREMKRELLEKSETEITDEAKNKLISAMQRLSCIPHHDITATIVPLPSEDMKGRIIGREGRNIKAFESATGTTLLIDETPDSVLISSFDAVRREIARVALENLIRDGRIHPTSIESMVENATEQIHESVTEFGEDAIRRLRLTQIHPEVVTLLGKLRYRLSNNQNSLDHSIEVANLCGLIAAELQLDVNIAKRAGLLHDIGKSLGEEFDGSHAVAGANILKRTGEDERVVNAVEAHHEEVPPTSPYAILVMIADSISAVRPGARAESMDAYIQRVKQLESLAWKMEGVQEVYAIQAGREIRVIVSPDKLDDNGMKDMARKLRRRIEDQLQYPGSIKISVIRESRVVEHAH